MRKYFENLKNCLEDGMTQREDSVTQKIIIKLDETVNEALGNTKQLNDENDEKEININILSGCNSREFSNHGWVTKDIHLFKVELRNFDGTNAFSWMNKIGECFELHKVIDNKHKIILGIHLRGTYKNKMVMCENKTILVS